MINTTSVPVDTNPIALGFTKQEWTIIFNVLIRSQYNIADAMLVRPIVSVIEPLVVVDSSKTDKVVESK